MAKTKTDYDDWHKTMLSRASDCFDFDSEQRERAIDDMKFAFVAGHQWDSHLTKKRRGRPCYEFNQQRQMVRRITGQQLKNKPQIKVRAVEDNDVGTADVINGLIKNIEVQSSAENAYDTAFQWACGGGYGVLRVVAEYESGDTFDQCLKIKTVMDPFTTFCDPMAREWDRSDAQFWFVTEIIPIDDFKRRWPGKPVIDFSGSGLDEWQKKWWFKDSVRIAEYWWIEKKPDKIYQLSDGAVVRAEEFDPVLDEWAQLGVTVTREREVERNCVYCQLVSGAGPLEDKTEWGGTMIPIVPQWGDLISIEGHQIYSGMVRFGRDAQTVHNFQMSSAIEVIAKMPNSPLAATPTQVKGLESYYERMGYDDPPVLLFNPDPLNPGAPQRLPIGQFPSGLVQMAGVARDELKTTMGIYDASLGAQGNESSGRAILARQNEGEISNFVYIDNQIKALKRLGEILVDAIPHYYDAERSIRILGEDNAEKYVQINKPMVDQQTGDQYVLNDLSRGKYDVTVTVGKNFDTARMELAEAAQALAGQPGPVGMLAQYMLLKSIDVPGMDEIVTAVRKGFVAQGLLEPGEGDHPPPPPQPNPKDVAEAKLKEAQANKAQAETAQILSTTDADVNKTNAEATRANADALRAAAQAGQSVGGFEVPPGSFGPYQGGVQ